MFRRVMIMYHISHCDGEFARDEDIGGERVSVNTNGIDGLWGGYTTWLQSKYGVSKISVDSYCKEFQWRQNHADYDLFALLVGYLHF